MMNPNNPAFPVWPPADTDIDDRYWAMGLTKREWIATRLMGALLSKAVYEIKMEDTLRRLSSQAVQAADILIEELGKQ